MFLYSHIALALPPLPPKEEKNQMGEKEYSDSLKVNRNFDGMSQNAGIDVVGVGVVVCATSGEGSTTSLCVILSPFSTDFASNARL